MSAYASCGPGFGQPAYCSDALTLLNPLQVKLALLELLGQNAFDQGFSICMVWLTAEVAIIARSIIGTVVEMLIAKTPKSWTEHVLRTPNKMAC